jgi:cytoskeleton protein RodZ
MRGQDDEAGMESLVNEQSTQAPAQPVVDTPAGLAALREARGLSRADLAQRLKLSTRQIDALEQGEWDALPGRAFVRGVVRAYGRMFDADVLPLLATVGAAADVESLRPSSTMAAPMPRRGALGFAGAGRGNLAVWVLLGVAVIVALVFFFGRGNTGSMRPQPTATPAGEAARSPVDAQPAGVAPQGDTPPAGQDSLLLVPAPPASPTPGASPAAPGAPGGQVPTSGASSAAPPAKPAAAVATPSTPPGSAPTIGAVPASPATPAASAATGAASAAAASPMLRIAASQDAWVEVRQADGRIVYSGIVRAGTTADAVGTEPLSLVVGNASQVRIEHRGRAVELRPGASDIARFQLP